MLKLFAWSLLMMLKMLAWSLLVMMLGPAAPAQVSVDAFWPWGRLDRSADQQQPSLLEVRCDTGELMVTAQNASVADTLKKVGECLGAEVDVSESAGERFVEVKAGPGPSDQILTEIFQQDFDYIIVGGPESKIRLIVVRDRSGENVGKIKPHVAKSMSSVKATFVDDQGIARLPSGLTPAEAEMTPEQLSQEFEKAKSEQKKNAETEPEEPSPPK